MAGLNQVHQGYEYQDLITAFFLAEALFTPHKKLSVDNKSHSEDLFDDIKVTLNNEHKCFQLKFSEDPNARFSIEDLKTKNRDLRLDDLIHSHAKNPQGATSHYTVLTTLMEPNDESLSFLLPTQSPVPFECKTYRIDPEVLWPNGASFIWKLRKPRTFTRSQLVDFCDRFLICVKTPRPTFDLRNAGDLENLVLKYIHQDIGIGHYPNQNKQPVETCATLIHLATRKRGSSSTVNGDEVAQYIQLRRDYGKIAQEFPVDKETLVDRTNVMNEFIGSIKTNKSTVLVGSPGAGKSWLVTNTIEHLRANDFPVAYHYCFISPFDTLVQQRINQKTLYGNLVSSILEELPELEQTHRPFFSATKSSLEDLLLKASSAVSDLFIFVDGLDHIERIRNQHPHISSADSSILSELEAISFPDNIHLILSSQPGPHLKIFEDVSCRIDMPEWTEDESLLLSKKIIDESKLDEDEWELLKTEQHQRAQGNPLYLTYIANEVRDALNTGRLNDLGHFLSSLPTINGAIENYYRHLLNTLRNAGHEELVADVFGLVEFSLNLDELKAILGTLASARLDHSISILKPILIRMDGQGGYRIYHDSFRRFIYDNLIQKGVSVSDALSPVISWMNGIGTFGSLKCYTFHFQILSRAGRKDAILDEVNFDFLLKSVFKGFSFEAIDTNLSIAINVTTSLQDIPKIIEIWEIRRALYTCFEDRLQNGDLFRLFNRCAGRLNGWVQFADSLLFEGKPTLSKYQGTLSCADADRRGAVVPWEEYLDLPRVEENGHSQLDVEYEIANFRGLVRTDSKVKNRLMSFLNKAADPDWNYFDKLIKEATGLFGVRECCKIIGAAKMTKKSYIIALINICEIAKRRGNKNFLSRCEKYLLKQCDYPGLAFRLMRLGFDLSHWQIKVPDITQFKIGLDGKQHHQEETEVRAWANSVVILAFKKPSELEAFRSTIGANGWYQGWLKFYISLCTLSAKKVVKGTPITTDLLAGLKELCKFDEPFEGVPRACDLYGIRRVLHASFDFVLSNFKTADEIKLVIPLLFEISKNTTTYLSGSPGGPLVHYKVLELIGKNVKEPNVLASLVSEIEEMIQSAEASGEYYEVQAEFQFRVSDLYSKMGFSEKAQKAFETGCRYLCSYGHRKDATIYELIDALPSAQKFTNDSGFEISKDVHSILGAVTKHTDGKGTSRIFIDWFDSVLEYLPESALVLLGEAFTEGGGDVYWQLENCLERVIQTVGHNLNQNILFSLEYGLRCDDDYSLRFERLQKILDWDIPSFDPKITPLIYAHLLDDSRYISSEWKNKINRASGESYSLANTLPKGPRLKEPEKKSDGSFWAKGVSEFHDGLRNTFNNRELVRYLRKTKISYLEQSSGQGVANFFGYRILSMMNAGQTEDVNELLEVMEEEFYFSDKAWLWEDLAAGFERYDYKELAASCLIKAYTLSKSGGGWMSLGGAGMRPLLAKAFTIEPQKAEVFYLKQIKEFAMGPGYGIGLSKNVLEDLIEFEQNDLAKECWDYVFDVIRKRLETKRKYWGPFSGPLLLINDFNVNEAAAYLMLARITHPEQRRKLSAMIGIVLTLQTNPELLVKGIEKLLRSNLTSLDLTVLLELIFKYEQSPFVLSKAILPSLKELSSADQFGVRAYCNKLISRAGDASVYNLDQCPPRNSVVIIKPNREFLNFLDRQNRVFTYSKILSDLPEDLMSRATSKFEAPGFKEFCQGKHKPFYSVITKQRAAPEYIGWERVIFDSVLQNLLLGRRSEIENLGLDFDEVCDYWREIVVSDSTWLIQRELSRIPRPAEILPETIVESDLNELPVVTDGRFKDWKIISSAESQTISSDRSLFEPQSQRVRLSGCILFAQSVPRQCSPFWDCNDPEDFYLDPAINGSLVLPGVCEWSSTVWGRDNIFRLNFNLVKQLDLRQNDKFGPIEYFDANGELVAKYQTWSTWFCGSDLNEEKRILHGGNLIVHPDLWASTIAKLAPQFIYRTVVFDKTL